ncbi:hypothetical protein MMC13_000160 [Lambiella insularis]|nr:hypothetical protein [Lambiella insularis]
MCSTKSLLLLAVIFVSTSFAACTTSESVSTFHDARVERVNSIGDIVTILKRGQPNIPKGYGVAAGDPQDGGELIKGFLEALELIRLATKELSSSKNDAIFKKYFNLGDKQVVKGVFEKLLGHDGAGAPELANIRVKRFTSVLDKKLTAKLANVKDSEDLNTASLEKCDKEHPELLLRNDAWYTPLLSVRLFVMKEY